MRTVAILLLLCFLPLAPLLGCASDDDPATADTAQTGDAATDVADSADVSEQVDTSGSTSRAFPADFYWGSATAGFQVDMGCPSQADGCVDPHSDWYAFVTNPTTVESSSAFLSGEDPAVVGPGHWELYEQDFDRAQAELGTNAYRYSFEWSRIFPTATDDVTTFEDLRALADAAAVQHYHDVLAALKARGVTPLMTIHHYTLPLWIHDGVGCHVDIDGCSPRGWLDEERIVREMAKYAGFLAKEFGGEVDLWITQNEPLAVVLPGFLQPSQDRTNPPAVSFRAVEAKQALQSMIYAHAAAVDAIRAADTVDADGDGHAQQVGLVYNLTPVAPADPDRALDVQAAENTFYLYNLWFMNAVAAGVYDDDGDGVGEPDPALEGRMDFVGINYYTRIRVEGLADPVLPGLSPLSTFNPLTIQLWEDYPQGLYEVAMLVKSEWGLPSLVTENGVIFEDDEEAQARFLVQHLDALRRAIDDGADVRGYCYWSLLDNFEWNHGTALRFGLFEVKQDASRTRTVREAGRVFQQIISAGAISEALAVRFGLNGD